MHNPFARKRTLLEKSSDIRRDAHLVESGRLKGDALNKQTDRLIERCQAIEPCVEWATDARGAEFIEAIVDQTTRLLQELPMKVLTDKPTAEADASLIIAYSNVLRIFNSPVLEYDRVREIVDKRLARIGDSNAG